MKGLDAHTGLMISDIDHVKQSISGILTTPVGTRVKLREYGSRLFDYIDKPLNSTTIISIISESAKAIDKWEPRVSLKRINPKINANGRILIDVEFTYKPDGKVETLRGVSV
jgi:uncharacterized protein